MRCSMRALATTISITVCTDVCGEMARVSLGQGQEEVLPNTLPVYDACIISSVEPVAEFKIFGIMCGIVTCSINKKEMETPLESVFLRFFVK